MVSGQGRARERMSRKRKNKTTHTGKEAGLLFLSVAGVIMTALLSMLLFILAGNFSGGMRTLSYGLGFTLITYAGLSVFQAWRLERQRLASLRENLRELEAARRQAENASQEKSRLLAAITHELRTPMNGVIGMACLLRDTPLTAEQESYVKAVETSGRALLSIIDELLDASRLEAGEFALEHAPFDLAKMVEETCELLSPRAHARDIDLVSFIDPALNGRVKGDAARIRQVLINLAGNAIKFTDRGGVYIRVTPDEGRADHVLFEIIDTGIGIREDEQARIFEPYKQAGSAGARRRGGTGLGLTISRRLARRMGGELMLKSAPGEGSVFSFSLPLPPHGAEKENEAKAQDGGRSLEGLKIILAIPDSPRRRALAEYVHAYGGKAHMAADAERLKKELRELARGGAGELICDAVFASVLRQAMAEGLPDEALGRVWLLLRPEERRQLAELMDGGLGGFLLTPLRRGTFVFQIVEQRIDARLDHSVKTLRRAAGPRAGLAGGGDKPLALLVEDNPVNAMLARAMLAKAGFDLEHAADGVQAVEFMRKALEGGKEAPPMPELILMDVHMPRMDGLETAQRIRAMEARAGGGRTPILALTASSGRDERDRCLAAGMDGFLSKPFDLPGLTEAIGKVLNPGERVRGGG